MLPKSVNCGINIKEFPNEKSEKMSTLPQSDAPTTEKTPDNPRSLKNLILKIVEETISLIPRHFEQDLTEEHKKELQQKVESVYLKIPQRDVLDFLETTKDPKALVEESLELIDGDGIKVVFSIKAGRLAEKGLGAFTEPSLYSLAKQVINVSLGHPDTHTNYSPILAEIAFIHNLMQKKRLTQRNPNEEIKFDEAEIGQLAENLTDSLIDVRGLIAKIENKINTGQYL